MAPSVLGLQDKIGNFEVGKDFDAILVDPEVEGSPLDVFDSLCEDSIEVSVTYGQRKGWRTK